jgi:hypothetical protein
MNARARNCSVIDSDMPCMMFLLAANRTLVKLNTKAAKESFAPTKSFRFRSFSGAAMGESHAAHSQSEDGENSAVRTAANRGVYLLRKIPIFRSVNIPKRPTRNAFRVFDATKERKDRRRMPDKRFGESALRKKTVFRRKGRVAFEIMPRFDFMDLIRHVVHPFGRPRHVRLPGETIKHSKRLKKTNRRG